MVGLGVEGVGGLVVSCGRIPDWVTEHRKFEKQSWSRLTGKPKKKVKPNRWKTLLNGKDKPNARGWVTCDVWKEASSSIWVP